MKYIIDEDIINKHQLTILEVLAILLLKESEGNYLDVFRGLLEENKIVEASMFEDSNKLFITQHWDDEVSACLLESDAAVPKKDRCEELALKLRELFPVGIKTGSAAWRGNKREITLRLQKFFKLYGNTWTDEEILAAAQKYIDSFNGNYTYMRILKYFIMKSERKFDEEGNSHVEDISELANWLENDTEAQNTDWLTNMV